MCARICYDLLWNYRSFTICDRTSFSRISEKLRLFQWISPNWSIWQNLLGRPFTSQGSLFLKWNQRWLWGENVLIVRLFEAQLIHLKDIIFHPVHLYSTQQAQHRHTICLLEGTNPIPIFYCRAQLRLHFPYWGEGVAQMGKIPIKAVLLNLPWCQHAVTVCSYFQVVWPVYFMVMGKIPLGLLLFVCQCAPQSRSPQKAAAPLNFCLQHNCPGYWSI